ncbi:bestrophin family protein [Pedobacter sp. Hv1]|uniref:bestrophin family protein n=1 Tax=Pedobacter sp. Hv1 TaxID=1740090 RepID=UPI0006D8A3FF|nr:bestrophin family ion channel [Pedobacter sp. Hv1]KQB99238.1 hypothetical protein AQF98_16825 [Pedobacter sp. Hv1]
MLITQNIRLSRVLIDTWKVDIIMIISCTAVYLVREYLIAHHFQISPIIPTVLGTAIAFFIGFNNNQAYDRWWEARKIWGALVNDSRSFARNLINFVEGDEETVKIMVRRHIAFIYALKANLRYTVDGIYIKYLTEADKNEVDQQSNMHNAILNIQARDLQKLLKANQIDGFKFIEMNEMLTRLTDSMGMCERIRNTVFPTTYSYLTKVFIWLFVVTFTLVISQDMGYWSIFMGWLIGFVFVSTQINGMRLVNPFETNSSSLPLNNISRTIEINLLQMIGETDIPEPIKPINQEYIL